MILLRRHLKRFPVQHRSGLYSDTRRQVMLWIQTGIAMQNDTRRHGDILHWLGWQENARTSAQPRAREERLLCHLSVTLKAGAGLPTNALFVYSTMVPDTRPRSNSKQTAVLARGMVLECGFFRDFLVFTFWHPRRFKLCTISIA